MQAPGGARPPAGPGGYPPQGAPPGAYGQQSYGGYPPQGPPPGAYGQPAPGAYPQGAPGGYPPQGAPGGYPPQGVPGGYPPQGAPGGYPPQGAPGGYPQPGYGSQAPPRPAGPPVGTQSYHNPAAQQYYNQIPPAELQTLQTSFNQVDTDRSGSITPEELMKLKLGTMQGFTLETAKKLVKVFDSDGSGNIGFYEYASLHRFVTSLQQAYSAFDRDRSGTLEFHECQQALSQGGFFVSPNTMNKVYRRFASSASGIKFEDFIQMCAFLGQVRSLFTTADYDRDGWIQLNLDSFMDLASNF